LKSNENVRLSILNSNEIKTNKVFTQKTHNYQLQPLQCTTRRLIKLESFNHHVNSLQTSIHNKKKTKLPIIELTEMFSYLKRFRSFKLQNFKLNTDCSQDIKISLKIRITNDSIYQIF
jgi:hypothetical protein